MKTAKSDPEQVEGPLGPAVVTAMHIDRPALDDKLRAIPGKTAKRRDTQFERACRLGQLVDKAMITDEQTKSLETERALDRRDAGFHFVKAWDISEPGSKDSLDKSGGGSAVSADGLTVARITAKNKLRSWEHSSQMGADSWMILRRVCGEDYPVAVAVAEISPSYRYAALVRFREALDALVRSQRRPADLKRLQAGGV